MAEKRIFGEENIFQEWEGKSSRKSFDEKQKRRLSSIRLQPLLSEASNKMPENMLANNSGVQFIRAAQTPLPDMPLTPGSAPPTTPLPEIPATPQPDIPATPRGGVAVLASSSAMLVEMALIKSFLQMVRAIKEGHREVWWDTEDNKKEEGSKRGELFSVLISWLIAAVLALFISYYLSGR